MVANQDQAFCETEISVGFGLDHHYGHISCCALSDKMRRTEFGIIPWLESGVVYSKINQQLRTVNREVRKFVGPTVTKNDRFHPFLRHLDTRN